MDKAELILQIKKEYGWDEDVPMSFSPDDLAQIQLFAETMIDFAEEGALNISGYRLLQFAETSAYHCFMLVDPYITFSQVLTQDIENLFELHLYDHDAGEWPHVVIDEREILVIFKMVF